MKLRLHSQQGFTLLTSLLLMIVISGLAVGLVYMVNSEHNIGATDAQNNQAYYAAEAGMEKMMSDLANLYTVQQSPQVSSITALASNPPTLDGITYPTYQINVPLNKYGAPAASARTVSTGPFAGLVADIIPMTLNVTAQRPLGQQVALIRNVEVALIPVFQFGVFSDSDLSYFPGPKFDFAGRVHTNGNLFLSDGTSLTFHDKITAVGDVVRMQIPNTVETQTTLGQKGPVYIPTAPGGCDSGHTLPGCRPLAADEGSVTDGLSPRTANTNWSKTSQTTYSYMIMNGATGAQQLTLPFVQGTTHAWEIVRQPAAGEDPTAPLGQSRLYNQAQIRVLLADNQAELPGGTGDSVNNVPLSNTGIYASGVPVSSASSTNTMWATADSSKDSQWLAPCTSAGPCPPSSPPTQWPLIGGYLRVERRNADGSYTGVTQEWIRNGFARNLASPSSDQGIQNTVHPNAILIFQRLRDTTQGTVSAECALTPPVSPPRFTGGTGSCFYPLNLYDTREGEVRDNARPSSDQTCAIGGVMNVVELDVGNLRKWILGTGAYSGSTGSQVENTSQNGYILYFSDRRGNLVSPTAGAKIGEYGFEDNVNSPDPSGKPNGSLDSGEDINANSVVDTYGAGNIGDGFQMPDGDPTKRINCMTVGRMNRVTAARHALKLVNAGAGNLPTRSDGSGGFTVASEQPVYVQGNYNANNSVGSTPPNWPSASTPSAVIADAVTILSTKWDDSESFIYPTQRANRVAGPTWDRLAIAAGKNLTFTKPSWAPTTGANATPEYGTDGGIHNFMRYLEDWNSIPANYTGSLVSFYPAQYGNGIFKCCASVYKAPNRNYSFDTNFLDPSQLPPGTPHFESVVNVGYRQNFSPQAVSSSP